MSMAILPWSHRRNRPRARLVPALAHYTAFLCGLADGFFATVSAVGFLPAMGISIAFFYHFLPDTLRRLH